MQAFGLDSLCESGETKITKKNPFDIDLHSDKINRAPQDSTNKIHTGSVVERPLCDREVAGSIPGRVIPKTLKMVLAALSLGAQH